MGAGLRPAESVGLPASVRNVFPSYLSRSIGALYGLELDRLVGEENFNPEVGFMRRRNFRRSYAQARVSPRTENNRLVRKWTYQAQLDCITDNDNRPASREDFAIQRGAPPCR